MDHFEYYLFSRISYYVEECNEAKKNGQDYMLYQSIIGELIEVFSEFSSKYAGMLSLYTED